MDATNIKYDKFHSKRVYLTYVGSLLDHSIGEAHNDSGFPEIFFKEIIAILEKQASRDEVYEMKNTLIYSWEKYHHDYSDDITEEKFKKMDKIINYLLLMTEEKFNEFVRMLLPHENKEEDFSKLFGVSTLENILYVLLEKTDTFPFKNYSYLGDDGKSYRVSLIDIQGRRGRIGTLIKEIINNSEFLKSTFNHDFLINRAIDGIPIGKRVDELDTPLDIRYKEGWHTGVENNIFKPNMEFISASKAVQRTLIVPGE